MNHDLKVKQDIQINKPGEIVWEALTNPEIFKQYFFGVELECDWQEGSDIIFSGEFNGSSFRDYGKILEINPGEFLRYSYFSTFSGLEDIPENYSKVTFKLTEQSEGTHLILIQTGFANEEAMEHGAGAWKMVLENMKVLLEKNT